MAEHVYGGLSELERRRGTRIESLMVSHTEYNASCSEYIEALRFSDVWDVVLRVPPETDFSLVSAAASCAKGTLTIVLSGNFSWHLVERAGELYKGTRFVVKIVEGGRPIFEERYSKVRITELHCCDMLNIPIGAQIDHLVLTGEEAGRNLPRAITRRVKSIECRNISDFDCFDSIVSDLRYGAVRRLLLGTVPPEWFTVMAHTMGSRRGTVEDLCVSVDARGVYGLNFFRRRPLKCLQLSVLGSGELDVGFWGLVTESFHIERPNGKFTITQMYDMLSLPCEQIHISGSIPRDMRFTKPITFTAKRLTLELFAFGSDSLWNLLRSARSLEYLNIECSSFGFNHSSFAELLQFGRLREFRMHICRRAHIDALSEMLKLVGTSSLQSLEINNTIPQVINVFDALCELLHRSSLTSIRFTGQFAPVDRPVLRDYLLRSRATTFQYGDVDAQAIMRRNRSTDMANLPEIMAALSPHVPRELVEHIAAEVLGAGTLPRHVAHLCPATPLMKRPRE